jgi:hypothetical protein
MPMGSLLLLVLLSISDFWVSDFVAVVFVAKVPMPFLHGSL